MPQAVINSSNIQTFFFTATFDLLNKRVVFDTSGSTYQGSSGSGILNVIGISFSLIDQDGVQLATIDFSDPTKYIVPSVNQEFILDLSQLNYEFFFQKYSLIGAIKDQDGTVYYTTVVYPTVCQPVGFDESGVVPGIFSLTVNCAGNTLLVKEATVFTYNNTLPYSKTVSGNLYYPTGTIAAISFSNVPFTNDVIYTGQYRINNDSTAVYSLNNDVYVQVVYRTANQFDVTCANKIGDLMCCIVELQNRATKNCNNSTGKAAQQQIAEITPALIIGLLKEINGQDASAQADYIRKTLNCNCGATSVGQNQMTPLNPSVTNIVITGVGGTRTSSATVGNTVTYNVISSIYQVVKGDTGDQAFSIAIDTSVSNTVKYKITFNYNIQAGYILNAIQASPSLTTQLNALIDFTNFNIDLTSLNGSCIIDLSSLNYFLSFKVASGADGFKNILINGTTYTPPSTIPVNTPDQISAYLNSLSLGVFETNFTNGVTGAYLNILSIANVNTLTSVTLSIGINDTVVLFQKTNKSLLAVLQALIDYLCGLTALQVALGQALSLCYFDYNGDIVGNNFSADSSQQLYNLGVANTICNLAQRINTLTAVTCAKLKTIFSDNPSAVFSGNVARVYGIDQDGNCVGLTVAQLALGIMQAANVYPAVKTAFCAIDCTTPASCPDVAGNNVAMAGSNIGIYGVSWGSLPIAVQTVTVKYKLSSSSTWITSTNALQIFPNGNINGTSPYQITGVTPGAIYDIWIQNNCGGLGFVSQFTVPTSSIYSGTFLLDSVLYTICGQSGATLYSSAPFGAGVIMYADVALTVPVTGYNYISDSTGSIFTIDSTTGQVLIDTGTNCTSGTAALYRLGNNPATICSASQVTLYTNGAFAPALTLYSDSGLTTPVTGYSYVSYSGDNTIYNLNSSTGVIGATTGASCTVNYELAAALNYSIDSVTGAGIPALGPTGLNNHLYGNQTGMGGLYSIHLLGSNVTTTKLIAYVNGVQVDCVAVTAAGFYNLTIPATSAQYVIISINGGTC